MPWYLIAFYIIIAILVIVYITASVRYFIIKTPLGMRNGKNLTPDDFINPTKVMVYNRVTAIFNIFLVVILGLFLFTKQIFDFPSEDFPDIIILIIFIFINPLFKMKRDKIFLKQISDK